MSDGWTRYFTRVKDKVSKAHGTDPYDSVGIITLVMYYYDRDYHAIVWVGLGQLTTFQNQRASSHSASIPVVVSNNCMFHAQKQTVVGTPSVTVRVAGVIIKVRHGCHDR